VTGELSVARALDHERVAEYVLVVAATDQALDKRKVRRHVSRYLLPSTSRRA